VSLCGLQNLGNTSYLNSVLQFICSIRQVASYFVNPKNGNFFEKNVDKYPLSYVMHRLCFHLYPYPELNYREIYKPDSIMQILGLYNVIYQDYGEKNPNEFILFLLNKLHEELNAIKIKNESNVNFDKIKDDKNAIINNGMKNFINNNNSIISNYFVWFEIKNIHCIKCSKDIYSFNNFPTFELNIIEIAKVKNIQNVKIEDCLEFYELNKLQKTFCSSCKNYEQLTSRNKIYSSPNFFLFLLDLKENKNINFIIEPRINLEKFIENKTTPTKYELNGIVFFDLNKNKYNALCISPVDKRWYLFDDKNVDLFDFNDFNNFYVKGGGCVPRILLYNGSIKK
jgi:ubiquitin C-terminal hydrolase